MKYSIAVKFIAIVLCAFSLIVAFGSIFGIVFLESSNLYQESLDDRLYEEMEHIGQDLANYKAEFHCASTLGNCPQDLLEHLYFTSYYDTYRNHFSGIYGMEIRLGDDIVSTTELPSRYAQKETHKLVYSVTPSYPVIAGITSSDGTNRNPVESAPDLSAYQNEKLMYTDTYTTVSWRNNVELNIQYSLNYYQGPSYEVTVYFPKGLTLTSELALMELLYPYRNVLFVTVLLGLLISAVTMVYLIVSAGRSPTNEEIRPGGLNRLPLDFYTICASVGIALLSMPIVNIFDAWGYGQNIWDNIWLWIMLTAACCFSIALILIGVLVALAAQSKMGNGYWWRHSCIGWLLHRIHKFLCYTGHGIAAIFQLMPIVWQWLSLMLFLLLSNILFVLLFLNSWGGWQIICFLLTLISFAAFIAFVCYGGYCIGTLIKGTKIMAEGNLQHKIPTNYLFGIFKDFASQLNALGGAAQAAVDQQLKSERMKTELITNVSHDIKTPLTSIINYADLLQRPHSEADNAKYLEVLDRQSHQLKKLIEDLMDMSKASSGNMTVEITEVDAVESVNQALGEFSDKLEKARLVPVFHHPDYPVTMHADGRLVWRILSNLLNNAVKYALPGTRLYIDLSILNNNVVISMKNISKDQLNVDAEDLMERFVRGDTSRNTEGSGLGLNIAKSLAELQKGKMNLVVDGDLFKVTLVFPLV